MELHQLVDISKPHQVLTNNHKDMEQHHQQLGTLDNLHPQEVMVLQLKVNHNPKDMVDTTKVHLLQLLAVMANLVVLLLQVVVVVMVKEVNLGVIVKDQATISKHQEVEVETTIKVVVIEVAMEDVVVVDTIKVVVVDITEVDITAVVVDLVEVMTIQVAVVGMEVEAVVEIEEVSEVEEVLHVEVEVNQSWVAIIRLKMV